MKSSVALRGSEQSQPYASLQPDSMFLHSGTRNLVPSLEITNAEAEPSSVFSTEAIIID